jgi:hypothetical protein
MRRQRHAERVEHQHATQVAVVRVGGEHPQLAHVEDGQGQQEAAAGQVGRVGQVVVVLAVEQLGGVDLGDEQQLDQR